MNLIRTCALAALALASALVLTVFSVPASAAEQQRTVEPFEAVHSYGSFKLVLRQATPAAVRLHGDPALLERVETRVVTRRGLATLEISLRRGERFEGRGEIGIDIDVPSLRALGMSGAGAARATGLDVKDLRVELAGSGMARLEGRSTQLAIAIGGSGDGDATGLAADDVAVEIAGSGDASVQATRTLAVSIAGSGDVSYAGNPVVTSRVAGSGHIARR